MGLHRRFGELQPVVERNATGQTFPKQARLAPDWRASRRSLVTTRAETLVDEACLGNPSQRLGVAQMASGNIGKSEHQQWCEQKLLLFFDDDDSEVCQKAATCFPSLGRGNLWNPTKD